MVRNAARMKIHSVVPMEVTRRQLVAAISATVAGFAVTLRGHLPERERQCALRKT